MHAVMNGEELLSVLFNGSLILMRNLQQCKLNLALALVMVVRFMYIDILRCRHGSKIWTLEPY